MRTLLHAAYGIGLHKCNSPELVTAHPLALKRPLEGRRTAVVYAH